MTAADLERLRRWFQRLAARGQPLDLTRLALELVEAEEKRQEEQADGSNPLRDMRR